MGASTRQESETKILGDAVTIRERLADAIVVAAVILVGAAVWALWQYFTLIGLVILIIVFGGVVGWLVLKGYEKYAEIQHSREREGRVLGDTTGHGQVKGLVEAERSPLELERVGNTGAGNGGTRTFTQALRGRELTRDEEVLVGYGEDGGPVYAKPQSLGIGGVQGAGKTVTTLNTVLSQIVFFNGNVRYLVVDPHMYADTGEELVTLMDGLWPFFLNPDEVRTSVSPDDHKYQALLDEFDKLDTPNPTEGGSELLQWCKLIRLEMERRLQGKKGPHWVVIIDEFSAVMQNSKVSKEVGALLEALNEQARKLHITVLLIGQVWKATRTGGSELRDTLPQFKAHRMSRAWAKLLMPEDVARKVERLPNYEIVLWYNGTDTRVRVPYTTQEDAANIARLYSPLRPGVVVKEVREERKLLNGR